MEDLIAQLVHPLLHTHDYLIRELLQQPYSVYTHTQCVLCVCVCARIRWMF